MHSPASRSVPLRLVLPGLAIAAALFLAGCNGDDKTVNPPGGPTISIVAGAMNRGTTAYSPSPDTVAVGSTVHWVNNDSMQHTATSDTNVFDVVVGPGAVGSFTFTTAGSYPYHCRISGHVMSGIVVVQ